MLRDFQLRITQIVQKQEADFGTMINRDKYRERERKTLLFIHYRVVVVHNCNLKYTFLERCATCW